MTSRAFNKILAGLPLTASAAVILFSMNAYAQTAPGDARPGDPSPTQTTQPSYPSADPPRGTTPEQRRVQQQENMGAQTRTTLCDQADELERSECLRRDMTNDDDRPAGVTQSMHQRRQQAQQEQDKTDSANVASEADTASDQSRRRTRTASSERSSTEDQSQDASPPQASDDETNNASDTLGPQR
jgi:hypothetical protein